MKKFKRSGEARKEKKKMEQIKSSSSSILYYNQPKNGITPCLALTPHSFLTRSKHPHFPRRKRRLT
jgi:hypothetical protein